MSKTLTLTMSACSRRGCTDGMESWWLFPPSSLTAAGVSQTPGLYVMSQLLKLRLHTFLTWLLRDSGPGNLSLWLWLRSRERVVTCELTMIGQCFVWLCAAEPPQSDTGSQLSENGVQWVIEVSRGLSCTELYNFSHAVLCRVWV